MRSPTPPDKAPLNTLWDKFYTANLPDIHKDPFDRIIIAQAILEDMSLLTRDGNILKYSVKVIW